MTRARIVIEVIRLLEKRHGKFDRTIRKRAIRAGLAAMKGGPQAFSASLIAVLVP